MSLKNAAIFLFAAAIGGLLGNLLRATFHAATLGLDFYIGVPALLLLLSISEKVIFLLLGLSYKKTDYNPQGRKIAAVFMGVTGMAWLIYYGWNLVDRILSGPVDSLPYDYLIWCALIILLSIAQVIFGILIASENHEAIRKAALPYFIISGIWAIWLIYHMILNFYHFGLQAEQQIMHMADLLNIVFFVSACLWALAVFRSNGTERNSSIIDQL